MAFIVYLDESGDHDLTRINPHFPVFVLLLAVIEQDDYIDRIIPAFNRVKFAFFGSEAVVFHSYEIRKSRGAFRCLLQPSVRASFLPSISRLMPDNPYRIIAVAIKKEEHRAASSTPVRNPYAVALERALERLIGMLEMRRRRRIVIIAEQRGKHEDADLRESFERFVSHGTPAVSPPRVHAIAWTLTFVPKRMNCIGHQIADLAGAPIAAYVLSTIQGRQTNDRAYAIIRDKMDVSQPEILPE